MRLNTKIDHSFAGLIRNQTGGGLNLVKDGPATQEIINILAATNGIGAITINNGKLAFNLIPNGINTNTIGPGTIQLNSPGVLGMGGEWTLSRVVSGDGAMLKQGTGNVVVNGASDFVGPVNVAAGFLSVGLANNVPSPVTSALGNMQVARDITVNSGGTLRFTAADAFGGASTTVVARLVVNAGGAVTNAMNIFTTLGPVLLNGGALNTVGGAGAGFQSYSLSGSVTTGGTAASTIGVTGAGNAFNGVHLNSNTVFNVADATAGSDLNVGAPLLDRNLTLGGSGGLTKAGLGTMTLTGTSPFTGDTIVAAGSLIIAGTLNGTARVEVQSGATLGGAGTINPTAAGTGNVTLLSGGKLAPGTTGVGTLTTNFSAGGQFDITQGVTPVNSRALIFDLATPAASDRVRTLGGPLAIETGFLAFDDFSFNTLAGFDSGTYTLFDGSQAITGSFDPNAANLSGTVGGLFGTIGFGDGGNDIVLMVIPEPGMAATLLAGFGALLGFRRRRRR